jgi:hypothetical protein
MSESVGSLVLGSLRFATSQFKVDMSPIPRCSVVPTEVSVKDHRSSRNRAVKIHETLGEAISVEQEGPVESMNTHGMVSALRSFVKLLVWKKIDRCSVLRMTVHTHLSEL